MVRCALSNETERVQQVVEHGEIDVARRLARAGEAAAPALGAGRGGAQVDRGEPPLDTWRPGGAAAGVRTRTVVIDAVDLVGREQAGCGELLLDAVADERTARCDLRVGTGHAEEGHVELPAERVDAQLAPTRLGLEPAPEGRDRPGERPVRIEAAVGAVTGDDVCDVDLGQTRVVRPVRRGAVERTRRSAPAGCERDTGGEHRGEKAPSHGGRLPHLAAAGILVS